MSTSQVKDLERERTRIRVGFRHVEQVPAAFGHEAGANLRLGKKIILFLQF